MKYLFITILLLALCVHAQADLHLWTFTDGRTTEAEFVSVIGKKVALKNARGKIVKVNLNNLTEADQEFIQLSNPPQIDINFKKPTKMRVYPENPWVSEFPQSSYITCSVQVKQTSTAKYTHELTLEMFAFAEEINGDKKILLDYQKKNFFLDGSGSTFEITGETKEFLKYRVNRNLGFRGSRYGGHLIVITDKRGKIIAYKATSKRFITYVENLRKLHPGCFFNPSTGERCHPTRPKKIPNVKAGDYP